MRTFRTRHTILKEEFFYSPKWGVRHCLVRASDDSYIGGSGQIIDFSADGGLNWIRVANFTPTNGQGVFIAYDRVDTFVIICGTTGAGSDGTFRSTDSGASFTRVTGITGWNQVIESINSVQYADGAGSSLWATGFAAGSQMLRESTDDGSSWTDRTVTGETGNIVQAHNTTGMILGARSGVSTTGLFDADGVSLPNFTANFFGLGASWSPFTSSSQRTHLFADGLSSQPGRFFGLFHESGSGSGARNQRIVYSDDGTTWNSATYAFTQPNMDSDSQVFWGFDGEKFHCLVVGVVGGGSGPSQFWLESIDGVVWHNNPRLPQSVFSGNLNTRVHLHENT